MTSCGGRTCATWSCSCLDAKVTDLHRVMEVAKSLWLLLEHSNEAREQGTRVQEADSSLF